MSCVACRKSVYFSYVRAESRGEHTTKRNAQHGMSILDAFGRNERSGIGGRNKGATVMSDTAEPAQRQQFVSSVPREDSVGNNNSSNRNDNNQIVGGQRDETREASLQFSRDAPTHVFDPNMFGDNHTAQQPLQQSHQQSQQQQQRSMQLQQQPPRTMPQPAPVRASASSPYQRLDAAASFTHVPDGANGTMHELECDDGSEHALLRMQARQAAAGAASHAAPPRPHFVDNDRLALEQFVATDDFIDRFNEESAARRHAKTMSVSHQQQQPQSQSRQQQQQQQQQQRAPVVKSRSAGSVDGGAAQQLVPVCPGCFARHVRVQQQQQQQAQPARHK